MAEFHIIDAWNFIVRGVYAAFLWLGFLLGFLLLLHPVTNVAIGYLAASAFLVSLRDEHVTHKHKALWAVMTIMLCAAEYRAIDNERTEQFKAHLHDLTIQREAQSQILQYILETSNHQMTQNQSQFEKTVADITKSIDSVTGGKTFCYVIATYQEPMTLAVFAKGATPLHEVKVDMVDVDAERKVKVFSMEAIQSFTTTFPLIPFLESGSGLSLAQIPGLTGVDKRNFAFNFFSLNGSWHENLSLRRVNGAWVQAVQVTREIKGKGNRRQTLYTIVPDNYPRVNGQPDW
jgi:hypothetical protein